MTDRNLQAFLDMVAFSELGPQLLKESDNGYNVLVGSTPAAPLLFNSYADHPHIYNKALNSTAAGRYQLLYRWWVPYKNLLMLPDFSPRSQDAIAIHQITERHALGDIKDGDITQAIEKCSTIWASLPGSPYGQHINKLATLLTHYQDMGGAVA